MTRFRRVERSPKWTVAELIELPLRDPARREWGVTRKYVARVCEEIRNRYRATCGRKCYRVKVEPRGPRLVRIVVRTRKAAA